MADTFVNLDLLYERIDGPLRDMRDSLSVLETWLKTAGTEREWVPAETQRRIEWAINDGKKASDLATKIRWIFSDLKKLARKKKATSIRSDSGKTRVESWKVIEGGLLKEAQHEN